MKGQKPLLGLLQRRECLVPTWKGWLALVFLLGISLTIAVRCSYTFLAVNDPIPGGILVVEGWASDAGLAETVAEFRGNHYDGIFVTGGPIEVGAALIAHGNYADLTATRLVRMGVAPGMVHAIPAGAVAKDRTYASAVALRKWLQDHGITATKINIMGGGAHTRRTRLLYEKAFKGEARIGVTLTKELDFDPNRWWASSAGFRTVVGEMIAYGYARLIFTPDKPATSPTPQ